MTLPPLEYGLQAARCPTAGGRSDAFAGHFMAPRTATVLRVSTLQKRPPGGRSGAARRRAEARLDSAQGVLWLEGAA